MNKAAIEKSIRATLRRHAVIATPLLVAELCVSRRADLLTLRQRNVFDLIAAGWTNKAIAADLGISETRVEQVTREICLSLGVQSRAEIGYEGGQTNP